MHDLEDELIGSVARALREPVDVDHQLDDRVMAAVRALPQPAVVRRRPDPWAWIARPRTLRLSPLAGMAMAAAVAGIAVLGARQLWQPETGGAVVARQAPADAVTTHRFVLVAPQAGTVSLVGDFNDWDEQASPLVRAPQGGVWMVDVQLRPGRYTYTFVVDGKEWIADPRAPQSVSDDFGKPSSVITVGTGSET